MQRVADPPCRQELQSVVGRLPGGQSRLPHIVFGVAERLRCARHLPSKRQPVPRRRSGVRAGDGNAAAMSRAGIPLPRVAVPLPRAAIPLAIVCVVAALALVAGCQRAQVESAAADKTPSLPRLERQSDGSDALRFGDSQLSRMTFATVKEIPLPAVLEANGQVTFDDRRVATIISRVAGRVDELRTSQWDTVRRGEQVMSLYSPDLMTAEAEYLEATSSGSQTGGSDTEYFGLPAGSLSMTANLKAAAARKLELLGFSPPDIAAIRKPSASVRMR